jgi:peptidoglycan L-alanyl-D-glutamate endopeptidase CwlK
VTSTRRTEAEQLALFAQGREKLSLVNKLRTGAGMPPIQEAQNKIRTYKQCSTHESGLAFDVAIVRAGAAVEYAVKVDVNENEISDYEEIGAIGESLGLRWGGRFKFRDYVHFECLR